MGRSNPTGTGLKVRVAIRPSSTFAKLRLVGQRQSTRARLIVNADDFGLTNGVNQAILELNEAGVLTSATLMATGAAFRAAVHAAFAQTTLDVGCHIVLVDGTPVLPHTEIPTLATAGRFRPTLGAFVKDLLQGKIRESEIEAEATAQIERIQSSGLFVSHVDTHKHTHMFARVLRPLLRAALARQVQAIRNPFEPWWSVKATRAAGWERRLQVHLLRAQHAYFRRTTRKAGVATTDGSVGVLATGTLDAATLKDLLRAMPAGTWELVCHPGYLDAELSRIQTRLRQSRETERLAILEILGSEEYSDQEVINFKMLERQP